MKSFTENTDLRIRQSRNDSGIFTKRPFAPEETIFQITGPFITGDIDEDIDDITRSNAIRYDEDVYISPQGRIADFLNHSCNPNAAVMKKGKKLYVVAIKKIPQNREVLIDYSTITAADDIWTMRCNCGSKQCRCVIRNVSKLSTAIAKKYIQRSLIPSYILAIE